MSGNSNSVRTDLLNRVAAVADVLETTASESEQNRKLCLAAVDALHEQKLFGIWCPQESGGFDADYAAQVDAMVALARADMSACWNVMIGTSISAMMARGLPEPGFQEVFSGDRPALGAGSLKPAGQATAVEGGYRASGSWGFGSGIHHSGWIVANCVCDGVPVPLVVPIAEVQIADDWHVSGLCGSGSSSYAIDDVYVPLERVIGAPARGGDSPNANLHARLPFEHASVSLGGARHALDELIHQSVSKFRLVDQASVASKQAFRVELGKLESQWHMLFSGVRAVADEFWQAQLSGSENVDALALKTRSVCALATEQCLEIGGRALRHAGAGAILESNVLQRIHRDLVVSAQHFMISDVAYEDHAGALLS